MPWTLIVLSVLILLSALLPLDPIRDAVAGGPAVDARLDRSLGYIVLGPISGMFDAMTLFTVGQIIAFTLWAIGLYGVARYRARQSTPVSVAREAAYALIGLVVLAAVYGAAVIMPRPMAQLVVTRSDVIAVDFHSHTHYSHDGRSGWSAADVRDWHAAAGYNAAYITDHASLDGVMDALHIDSTVAGHEMTLLPGLEAIYHGEHVNVLNAGVRFKGLTTADLRTVDDQALALGSAIQGLEPVLIETVPGNFSQMLVAQGPGYPGIRAIEIVDGSPRGMSQANRDHDAIVHLADSLNLALVAGSDNHGWGRAAPGWTLIRLPDWRGYAPDALGNEIEKILRLAGRPATRVVERTTAPGDPLSLVVAMPVVVWTVLRSASPGERLAWLVWIWAGWAIVAIVRRGSNR